MINVLISLLKGSCENKYKLSRMGDEALDIIKDSSKLKELFKLEKGRRFGDYETIIQTIKKRDIGVLTIGDYEYPPGLLELNDPPFLLYYRGDLLALDNSMVSVVGTRKPTLTGHYSSFQLGLDFGKSGMSVVSGLAKGIDSGAHSGNIAGGGKTIAVLGNGIDSIYPKSNFQLASNIVESGGLILSEFPPGEEVRPYNFPKRNRIVAGLSWSTVVVQAPKRSGSLITGEMALDLGRDVYVHSSGVGDSRFIGSDHYSKDGAIVIERGYPVIHSYGLDYSYEDFSPDDYSSSDLLKMEIEGEIIKYRGSYFKL